MRENSYVTSLFRAGSDRIIQKVGEEATEVVIAAKNSDKKRLIEETSDLWFHMLILLVSKNISLDEIYLELKKRQK
jgi:phosphoribosyl-ATP pyrophosphohydrolase